MVTNMLQHYITKKRKYINHHGNKITNNTITILVYECNISFTSSCYSVYTCLSLESFYSLILATLFKMYHSTNYSTDFKTEHKKILFLYFLAFKGYVEKNTNFKNHTHD